MEFSRCSPGLLRPALIRNLTCSLLFLTCLVPFSSAAIECIFNRTYKIPTTVSLEVLLRNQGDVTDLPFDRDAFVINSHWGTEINKSVYIEETHVIGASIILDFPSSLTYIVHASSLSIGDKSISSTMEAPRHSDGTLSTLTERDMAEERENRAQTYIVFFDVIDVIDDWLTGANFSISIDDDIGTEDGDEFNVRATLEVVIEDTVRESDSCSSDQFQCNDGRCLETIRVCDAIADCLHQDDETICGNFPVGSVCNFDGGPCGWHSSDPFWLRNSGATPSSGTGPVSDHTSGTSSGFYMYTEASDMKMKKNYTARIQSPLFYPPAGNSTSGDCKVTFYYQMNGIAISSLRLYAVGKYVDRSSWLFNEAREVDQNWHKKVAVIESSFLRRLGGTQYFLEFEGSILPFGGDIHLGDMAVDDISMSRECFGLGNSSPINHVHPCDGTRYPATTSDPTTAFPPQTDSGSYQRVHAKSTSSANSVDQRYRPPPANSTQKAPATKFRFTSCAQIGDTGPTQEQCDRYYANSNVSVLVRDGYQKWTVPQTGFYRITAMGAKGGTGVQNPGPSNGAVIEAVINLTSGHNLYILVGQAGYSACSQTRYSFKPMDNYCNGRFSEEELSRFGTQIAGGGGAGGGGTFIALEDPSSTPQVWKDRLVPLVAAGGGGGLSFKPSKLKAHGLYDLSESGSGRSGSHGGDGATHLSGAGGGWFGNDQHNTNGQAFIFGGRGGKGCGKALDEFRWELPGGFGGGGGGCTSGGGGGGYTGGNGSFQDSLTENGAGGSSYVSDISVWSSGFEGKTNEHGQVVIEMVLVCSDSSFALVGSDGCDVQLIPLWAWIIIMTAFMLLFAFLLALVLCRAGFKRSEEDRLRNELALLRKNVMSETNPLYGARKSIKEEDFPELPRTSLKLLHPLGNGAFGEVYKGVYYPFPDKFESMSVAIKTLSKEATEEHRNDFLMEAVIMGSLKHKNVVKLIGVSFIRVPKFLILEYMNGGELKTFLQNNRPSYSKPSNLKMLDLLKVASDVADGCKYLETLMFIHRDIAARNILLTTRGPGRVAKIGDFGMAKDIYKSEIYKKSRNSMVPVKWMPPEAYLDGVYSTKTDVWAFGVLLWEIMTFCYIPYPGLSNHEVIQCVARGDRMCPPRYCPKPLKDLMESCWRKDPEQRPTFEYLSQLLCHLCTLHDVISVPIPSQGIEVDRGLVTPILEAVNDFNESSPMLQRHGHFVTDPDGYLQSDLSSSKPEGKKRKPIRLDKIKVDFPKNVEMNIYDKEVPTSGSTSNNTEFSGTPNDLDHEYSFPPGGASRRGVNRTDSLV